MKPQFLKRYLPYFISLLGVTMKGLTIPAGFPTKSDEALEGRRTILGEKWYLDKRRKEINIYFFPWCGVGGVRSCLDREQFFYEQYQCFHCMFLKRKEE